MNMKTKNAPLGFTSIICLTLVFSLGYGPLTGNIKAASAEVADNKTPISTSAAQGKAHFINTHGENIGTALFQEGPNGVLIKLDLKNLSAGEHAIHIHETGTCTPVGDIENKKEQDFFKDAGGHFNPHHNEHGLLHEQGPHAGDLPNITIAQDGSLQATLFNDHITLNHDNDAERGHLFDEDGSALIIHSGTDDYHSAPSGNAGNRIACAVIEKSE